MAESESAPLWSAICRKTGQSITMNIPGGLRDRLHVRRQPVAQISILSVSLGIVPSRDDFGVRWQSAAATPLFGWRPRQPKRRGASLPAALQEVWLRLRRAALYRRFPTCGRQNLFRRSPRSRRPCRLEVGDTADWKSALRGSVVHPTDSSLEWRGQSSFICRRREIDLW